MTDRADTYRAQTEDHLGQRTSLTLPNDTQVYILTDFAGNARQVRRENGQVVGDPQIDREVAEILMGAGFSTWPWNPDEARPDEVILTNDPFFAPKPAPRESRAEIILKRAREERNRRILPAPPRAEPVIPGGAVGDGIPFGGNGIGGSDATLAAIMSMQQQLNLLAEANLRLQDENMRLHQGRMDNEIAGRVPAAVQHNLPDGTVVSIPTGAAPTADEATGERQVRPEPPAAELTAEEEEAILASTRRGRGSRAPKVDPLSDIPTVTI